MSRYRCLQPNYVSRFQCDGTVCDAQCCRGWNIQLDIGAIARFRKAPKLLRRKLFSHIAENKVTGLQEIVKEKDSCPFLGKDRLCILQKRKGLGFLADVCAEYPRLTTQFPDMLERALCVTCPVVARLALLDKSPMEFEEVEIETGRETYFQQADDAEAIEALRFFDVQKGGIRILQDRSLSLPERLTKLESFLGQAEDLLAEGKGEAISRLPEEMGHGLPVLPFSLRFPMIVRLLDNLMEKSEDDDPKSAELRERIHRALEPEQGAEAKQEAAFAAYEKEILEPCSHILENYLVNEYFGSLYPCAALGSFRHNAQIFLAMYSLLELFLVSLLAEKAKADEEDIIAAVQWLAVRVKHFLNYTSLVSDFLKENEGFCFAGERMGTVAETTEKLPEESAASDAEDEAQEDGARKEDSPYESEILQVNPRRLQIQSVPGIVYAQESTLDYANVPLCMDVLRPKERRNLPAVIFVTGGGFIASDRARCLQLRLRLAEAGYFVGSIQYRVTPEVLFPAPLEDVKSAIRYVRAHAEQLHADPDRIGVMGDSAGGYLAAFAGITNYPTAFDKGEHLDMPSSVKAAVDLYGVSDLLHVGAGYSEEVKEYYSSPAGIPSLFVNGVPGFGGRGGGVEANRSFMEEANPIRYITEESAPMLLLHGSEDQVVSPEQTDLLYQVLRKKGVEAKRYLVPGAGHAGEYWVQDEVIQRIISFFDRHLGKRQEE